jgi:hypothetical protein
MERLCVLWIFLTLAAFAACWRQQTDEQKNSEINMAPGSSASPTASAENRQMFKSQAQRFQPRRIVPMTSPIIEIPTPTPKTTPSIR